MADLQDSYPTAFQNLHGFCQEMAKSRPLDVKGQKGFKILILNEVDRISRDAQHSLRRTMEKYSSACRLVLSCSNISKVASSLSARGTIFREERLVQ